MKEKKIELEINGKDYSVIINEFNAHDAVVTVNDNKYKVLLKDLGIEQVSDLQPKLVHNSEPISIDTNRTPVKLHRPKSMVNASSIVAPLPGLILKLNVRVGDEVKSGQQLLIMEAMKMENEIRAKNNGLVKEILVKEGDSVDEGSVLITLE